MKLYSFFQFLDSIHLVDQISFYLLQIGSVASCIPVLLFVKKCKVAVYLSEDAWQKDVVMVHHSHSKDYLTVVVTLIIAVLVLMIYATNRNIFDAPPIYRPWIDAPYK